MGYPRTGKYNAKSTYVEGVRFASGKEARRWQALQILERVGIIRDLKRQVRFPLSVNGEPITTYVADFTYEEKIGDAWVYHVEDSKGFKTPEYKLKEKLMLAVHGIKIKVT